MSWAAGRGVGREEDALIKVTADRFEAMAPGCMLVCQVHRERASCGCLVCEWDPEDSERTVRIERGLGWVKLAREFGWTASADGGYRTESDLIAGAENYLDHCIELGTVIDDPGYFNEPTHQGGCTMDETNRAEAKPRILKIKYRWRARERGQAGRASPGRPASCGSGSGIRRREVPHRQGGLWTARGSIVFFSLGGKHQVSLKRAALHHLRKHLERFGVDVTDLKAQAALADEEKAHEEVKLDEDEPHEEESEDEIAEENEEGETGAT